MADATLHFSIDPLDVTASSIGAMTLVIETVGSGGGGGGGGVTSHSALTNLDADDHLHYLTAARGDARYDPLNTAAAAVAAHTAAPDAHPGYATDGELASALAGKADVSALAGKADTTALTAHTAATQAHGISAFGAALVDDTSAAAMRATLGLGSAATLTAAVSAFGVLQLDGSARIPAVNGSLITNLSAAQVGAYTQAQVDSALTGKSNSSHLHPGVYDPSGTAAALIATLLPLLRYGLQTPWPLVSGSVYDAAVTSAYTTIVGAAGRIDLYPVVFAFSTAINLFSINVTVAVAGALVRTLVYAADANGMPNTQLFSGATDLDCSTTGVKSHAESFSFQANTLYWIGAHHSANPTLTAIAAGGLRHLGLASATATTALTGIRRTGVDYASGPPATWGFNSAELVSGGAMPRVAFTIA